MYSPGASLFAAADLSAKKGIRFWAKGDGRTYRLMCFSQARGRMPLMQSFVATGKWKQMTILFSELDGFDGKDLMGVVFAAGPDAGAFAFQIDTVRFDRKDQGDWDDKGAYLRGCHNQEAACAPWVWRWAVAVCAGWPIFPFSSSSTS